MLVKTLEVQTSFVVEVQISFVAAVADTEAAVVDASTLLAAAAAGPAVAGIKIAVAVAKTLLEQLPAPVADKG